MYHMIKAIICHMVKAITYHMITNMLIQNGCYVYLDLNVSNPNHSQTLMQHVAF
jgi:hypothetical protein